MKRDIWQKFWPPQFREPQPAMEKLHKAILEGKPELVRDLLHQGASPNIYCEMHGVHFTPLQLAVIHRQPQSALWLLEASAKANCEVLRDEEPRGCSYYSHDAWSLCAHGLTALDLAILVDLPALLLPLIEAGARPGRRAYCYRDAARYQESVLRMDRELAKARAFEAALELVENGAQKCHDRTLLYLSQNLNRKALEEAAFAFHQYQCAGNYQKALQVTYDMQRIDSQSVRPFELRLRFLLELGRPEEASQCLEELVALHVGRQDAKEANACRLRFGLLQRGMQNGYQSRPQAKLLSERPAMQPVSEPGRNLPALPEGAPLDP